MIRRRLYVEERVSPTAQWGFRLALFAVPVLVLSIVLYRLGVLDFQPAMVAFGTGLFLAAAGGLLGAIGFFIVWESGWVGIGRAMAAVALALVVLAAPAVVVARGLMLPPLSDISTDLEDPPQFRALLLAHPREANSHLFAGASAGAQRAGYPGIKPADLSATPEEAFNAVLALVQKRGWHILDATPPRGTQRDGRIEAVATSHVMGYRNDVVIRIRPTAKGARVDMRSTSRYGTHDLGTNAERIEGLMADLSAERRKH
ncbi:MULTISPECIES: DUF1499 domain-containing protein [unclassified Xanthobacter]|uniref:DUF1499 domain-containing protein n=1 Tax=unclassified Xanthobacter TaxID=2623496 RepID=UPI001EDF942F|nr:MULTISPECIES: DUF1499 domain-containing protein [unclassified Xanthobacter]